MATETTTRSRTRTRTRTRTHSRARTRTRTGRFAGRVTPLGWTLTFTVPVFLVAGYRLGLTELIVLGFSALTLCVIALAHLLSSTALSLRVTPSESRVVSGTPARLQLTVVNSGARRSLPLLVELPILAKSKQLEVVSIRFPLLARDSERVQEAVIPARERGHYQIGPARSVRADPVGLLRRDVLWGGAVTLRVHPITLAITSADAGLLRDLEGKTSRAITDSDVSFHSLREYLPGDARHHIHWKSSAKTGTAMVRQFEQTRRSRVVVILSFAAGDYGSAEQFELAVSCAGSLALRALRAAGEVQVVVGARANIRFLDARTPLRLLDELSEVDLAESALSLRTVAGLVTRRVEAISVAYLICGSSAAAKALRAATAQFSPEVEVVVVVCDSGAAPARRFLADQTVLTVGYLNDLRLALSGSSSAVPIAVAGLR
ncbi:MAG: DUF58 domain-containing protein [Microbacteriaceae bacterium]|nr:DUF58 domain-containing protein [Microbacteriaceae bacterium]